VVLDANALMLPFQFRVNLDLELTRLLGACDVFVPSSVVGELERLAVRNRDAKAALRLAAKYEIYKTTKRGDVAVVSAAKDLGATVVTSDAALLKVLGRQGVPRITLRSRSHLVLED
jgi:rRNA-processing protein FCF1